MNLANERFTQKWHNVGAFFNRIRTTMPVYNPGGLSTEEYVDITAYLRHASDLPAGNEELKADLDAMKGMGLAEPGFERVFNGRDLAGFGFLLGYNCTPRPSGCGQTEPGTTFTVQNGIIMYSGSPEGYMYTQKKYLNFTLRFDYRYKPHEGMDSDADYYTDSGYWFFINDLQVWPKAIKIHGMNSQVLAVEPLDTKVTSTEDEGARQRALKPIGQWNSVEIVSNDGQIRSSLNETLISVVTQHEFKGPGHIGFQSEGGAIDWRNIRIKEE